MRTLLLLIGLMVAVAGCVGQNEFGTSQITISTDGGDVVIDVEIADTADKMSRGLMGRGGLRENSGMLFVFGEESTRSFWMMNMVMPLDIMFIDSGGVIVDIQTMVPCISAPCHIYTSAVPAMFALEVNAGFVQENDVEVGNRLIGMV